MSGYSPPPTGVFAGTVTAPGVNNSGTVGAIVPSRWRGATVSGPPVAGGPYLIDDWVIDGNGAIYICTVAGSPGIWTGPQLLAANNLSDVANATTARANLGLGSAATQASAAFDTAGAAAAAQAAAIAASAQRASNLSDLANVATARTNLGLGSAATQNTTAFDAAGAASTVQGLAALKANNLSDLGSASTARTNLGLGSAAVVALTSLLQAANNLSDLASASTARANLGLAIQGATTDLRQVLINLNLLTTGGASPLDLNGGKLTAATTKTRADLSGALSTTTLVSGTAAQIDVNNDRFTLTPITLNPTGIADATALIELSPDGTTYSTVGTETVPAAIATGSIRIADLMIPAGWRIRITVTNATIGTTTYY